MDGFTAFFQRSTRALPFCFLPLLVSCGISGLTASQKVDETSTVPSSNSSSLNPIGSGASSTAGFTIAVTNTNLSTYYLHQAPASYGATQDTSNFSAPCSIASNVSGTAGDMLCILDLPELDLYFNSIILQVNVPAGMCAYVGQNGYDFFNYQAGVGPAAVSYTKDYTGTIYPGPNVDAEGVPHCTYNYGDSFYHSGTNAFSGNCCVGDYTFTTSVQADSTSPFVTTVSTGNSWNGKIGNCLTGPAVTGAAAQTLTANEAVPEEMLTAGSSGLNVLYTIPAANQLTLDGTAVTSDVWAANFYNPSDFSVTDSATGINKPAGLTTFDGYTPQDTYAWNCYDSAQELQSRIRLFIRKWDTDPVVEGGNPNVTGFSSTYPSDPLDDHYDWKDFASVLSGAEYPGADI